LPSLLLVGIFWPISAFSDFGFLAGTRHILYDRTTAQSLTAHTSKKMKFSLFAFVVLIFVVLSQAMPVHKHHRFPDKCGKMSSDKGFTGHKAAGCQTACRRSSKPSWKGCQSESNDQPDKQSWKNGCNACTE
jgi:hypothetical protein